MAKFATVNITIDAAKIRRTMRRSLIAAGIPLHRADVPVDSCETCSVPHPCLPYEGRHVAPRVAAEQDER